MNSSVSHYQRLGVGLQRYPRLLVVELRRVSRSRDHEAVEAQVKQLSQPNLGVENGFEIARHGYGGYLWHALAHQLYPGWS